jgi:N-acetylmuramoyl-L-alanine amidase
MGLKPYLRAACLALLTMSPAPVEGPQLIGAAVAEPRPAARDLKRNTLPAYLGPLPRVQRGEAPTEARAPAAPPPATAAVLTGAAQLLASLQAGRAEVPRLELAARLKAGGFEATGDYQVVRENAARELAGRLDGIGAVSADEFATADAAIARQVAVLQGVAPAPSTLREVAKLSGRPQVPGLNIVYLHPLGHPADANKWLHIIAHQTEGPAGSAKSMALAQARNPTKRGVTVWVETDGTVYWSTAETAIPTHGDGANRNDNRYIDNSKTYRTVIRMNSIGVEFVGNFPDVAKPVTPEQVHTWLILVKFLQERYEIPPENVYAHNWIDYKDHRYCEGCELGTLARKLSYQPGK